MFWCPRARVQTCCSILGKPKQMDPDAIIITSIRDAHRRLLEIAHVVAKDATLAGAALRAVEDAIAVRGWANDIERALFVDNYSGELQAFKGLVAELASSSPDVAMPLNSARPTAHAKYPGLLRVMRSFMDRILGSKLQILRQPPTASITRVFEQLIQGITYFADQVHAPTSGVLSEEATASRNRRVIYHRLFACGDGSDAFRQTHLTCKQHGMSKKDRDAVKARIWRCYVERLIYDDLYRNMQSDALFRTSGTTNTPVPGNAVLHQDTGHLEFLTKTLLDFQTCYPCLEVRVAVDYDHHFAYGLRMPSAVRITRVAKCGAAMDGKRPTSTEVYQRDISVHPVTGAREYIPNVICRRYTLEGNEYLKVQSFHTGYQEWTHVRKHVQSAHGSASGHGAFLDLANASGRPALDHGSSVYTAATSHGAIAMHLDPSTDRSP